MPYVCEMGCYELRRGGGWGITGSVMAPAAAQGVPLLLFGDVRAILCSSCCEAFHQFADNHELYVEFEKVEAGVEAAKSAGNAIDVRGLLSRGRYLKRAMHPIAMVWCDDRREECIERARDLCESHGAEKEAKP